ncbi:MAG: dTMP kinase [Firmicutes bacterium]|nr:dTMP kinase [Bacillota bacterium]
MGGVFITIEGVEGAGKSTQLQRLETALGSLPTVFSREPGGTALGREIRSLLLAPHASGETWCPQSELLLFYADRAQHVAKVLRPALEAGKIVVVDRFADSTRAYQGASGVDDGTLKALQDLVLGDFRPDLTLVLDMDPTRSLARVKARNAALGDTFTETRFDDAALRFHQRVREIFTAIAQEEPRRVRLIDAEGSADEVFARLWAEVRPVLARAGFSVA